MLHASLTLARAAGACESGLRSAQAALGPTYGDDPDTLVPLTAVLDALGLEDAITALAYVPGAEAAARDRIARSFACDCAERVLPLFERRHPKDARPRRALEVARRFVAGSATPEELAAARAVARAVAWAAAGAVAWDAAWDAAGDAAWDAARAAAWDGWQTDHFRFLLTCQGRSV